LGNTGAEHHNYKWGENVKLLLLFGLFFSLILFSASAQHEADNWYFGEVVGVNFLGNSTVPLIDGRIYSDEGSAVVSDKRTGKLLFYTDGYNVYNAMHQIISGGTGLMSGSSSTQGMLIVPDPGNSFYYYLFTVPDLTSGHAPPTTKLLYSKISMQNPNGVVLFKNRVLLDNVSEKLTGTLDCSGEGFWVVTHLRQKNTFYAYHIVDTGVVLAPVISSYPEAAINHTVGYIKISPNRSQIALASENATSTLLLFDFDAKTGEITNKMKLGNAGTQDKYYGVSFSPDNSKLYVVAKTKVGTTVYESAIFQYETQLGNENSIAASRTMISNRETIQAVSALQLAPNGKLYAASPYHSFLDVIHEPNLKGSDCHYEADGIALSGRSLIGLPNFMDYIFNTGSISTGCAPLPVVEKISGCVGSDLVFVDNTSANSPMRSWYFERGTPEVSTDSAVRVRFADTGRYQVRLSYSTPAGMVTEYRQAVVFPVPVANAGGKISAVCYGNKVQLGTPPISRNTYQWTPATGLSSVSIANPIASPTKSTTYYLTVTNTYGCISTDSITVRVDTVKAITSADTAICAGSGVQLFAKGGTEYTWSPSEGLSDSTSSIPFAAPAKTTRYKVIVAAGECRDSGYVTITVHQKPTAIAGPDLYLCKGESHVLGSKHLDEYQYSWSPTTGISYPLIANPRVTCLQPMTYILSVTAPNGCTSYDTVHVAMRSIKAVASADVRMCYGGSVRLSASGGMQYNWTPAIGLDDASSPTPLASPTVTTRYRVIVSDGNCIDSAFVTVTVDELPVALAGADKTVCPGESTNLGGSPENGNTYSWQPVLYLDNPAISNPTATPIQDIDYILTVTTAAGCIVSDTVHLRVGNIIAFAQGDTTICAGASAQLRASGGSDYRWTPSAGLSNSFVPNPIATPESTTTYTVHVSSGKCHDSARVTIVVQPLPQADAGDDARICKDGNVRIGTPAVPGYRYRWTPAIGLSDATIAQPFASPSSGTTLYTLTVTSPAGCTATDSVTVTVGNIEAVVAGDTVVCAGTSVRLRATGGNVYQWSPGIGLSDSTVANPIATPNKTTKYKVTVFSGTCLDSAFVTVTVASSPTANAGADKILCVGESTEIGMPAARGNSYSWTPSDGLTDPASAQTLATPGVTTSYVLRVVNEYGCEDYDTVTVQVNLPNERSFTLVPDSIRIIPGESLLVTLRIPIGYPLWNLRLGYNSQIIAFHSLVSATGGVATVLKEENGMLSVRGTGESGELTLKFTTFLPATSQTVYPVVLIMDSAQAQSCEESVTARGTTLLVGDYCGKNIRSVSGTGKRYFLNVRERAVEFGVGLPGNVRLELVDYLGNSQHILVSQYLGDGIYSTEIDVPTGLYFCKMTAGMYQEIRKIMVVR